MRRTSNSSGIAAQSAEYALEALSPGQGRGWRVGIRGRVRSRVLLAAYAQHLDSIEYPFGYVDVPQAVDVALRETRMPPVVLVDYSEVFRYRETVMDQAPTVREAVGVFFDGDSLHQAVDDLESAGFDRATLGLLAGQFTVKQRLGEFYEEINESVGTDRGPSVAFVAKKSMGDTVHAILGSLFFVGTTVASGAVVASAAILGGGLLAAIGGVAVLGGIGGALALIIHESDAEFLEQQVDEGHLLLFVRTGDPDLERKAVDILSKHGAFDARVYAVPAAPPA